MIALVDFRAIKIPVSPGELTQLHALLSIAAQFGFKDHAIFRDADNLVEINEIV